MRYVLVVLGLLAGLLAFAPTEANAFVCARGVFRAGCVGPNGAVGVRRGFFGPRAVVGVRRGFYGPRAVAYGRFRRW